MIYPLLAAAAAFILKIIAGLGYAGVFLLMFLESSGVPAPSEIIMPFGGFLVSEGRLDFWFLVLSGTLGNLAGSLFFYWLGFKGGRAVVLNYGRYFLFSGEELARAEKWFLRNGPWSVFLGRLLPGVRTYISFPAGLARMDLKRFTLYTLIGALPWAALFAWLGLKLGERWSEVEKYLREFNFLIFTALLAALAFFVIRQYQKKRMSRPAS